MLTTLTDQMKANLLKIALELKKTGWKPATDTNDIDISMGNVLMYKEYVEDSVKPNVAVSAMLNLTFQQNQQQRVFFPVYAVEFDLWIEGVGNTNDSDKNISDKPFPQSANEDGFKAVAEEINKFVIDSGTVAANEFSKKSASDYYNNDSGNFPAGNDDFIEPE